MTIAADVREVSCIYGGFAALRRVSCRFEAGGMHLLLGANGAGKSTLLRVMAGLATPSAGTVEVLGGAPAERRSRIAYMSHAAMLYDEMSATENLQYFAQLGCAPGTCALCHASPEMALRAVGIDHTLLRPVSQYSQGMRQRVSLARVLLSDPELILLDEPFSNMDVGGARDLVELLRDVLTWPLARGEGQRTIVLTTHQHDLVRGAVDSTVRLERGTVMGEVDEALADVSTDAGVAAGRAA